MGLYNFWEDRANKFLRIKRDLDARGLSNKYEWEIVGIWWFFGGYMSIGYLKQKLYLNSDKKKDILY